MLKKTLLRSPVGTKVRIAGIDGEETLQRKLRHYGVFVGDQARLMRLAPLGGPLLVEINGREIALGRGIAAKILVEAV